VSVADVAYWSLVALSLLASVWSLLHGLHARASFSTEASAAHRRRGIRAGLVAMACALLALALSWVVS
jgi:hypothetical protein